MAFQQRIIKHTCEKYNNNFFNIKIEIFKTKVKQHVITLTCTETISHLHSFLDTEILRHHCSFTLVPKFLESH